ncbi:MAG: DUF4238 domain-containing protein [Actinomycetota bacterium]|nr:DUF4238 domain-containing protein [Actinomycetota bacterium]
MGRHRRHHLVPQFLLRRFADANGKLIMVKPGDLEVAVPVTVNNACNEAGFTALRPRTSWRRRCRLEGRADNSIRNLLAGEAPRRLVLACWAASSAE